MIRRLIAVALVPLGPVIAGLSGQPRPAATGTPIADIHIRARGT